jgi:hypothetical protein
MRFTFLLVVAVTLTAVVIVSNQMGVASAQVVQA